MGVATALAAAGLGYAAVFIENFPQDLSQLIVRIISALGLAFMFCLLVTSLLEARLGGPVTTPLPDIRVGDGNGGTVLIVAEVNGFPGKTESTAQG